MRLMRHIRCENLPRFHGPEALVPLMGRWAAFGRVASACASVILPTGQFFSPWAPQSRYEPRTQTLGHCSRILGLGPASLRRLQAAGGRATKRYSHAPLDS